MPAAQVRARVPRGIHAPTMQWQTIYDSAWNVPAIPFAVGAVTLALYARRRDFLGRYAAVFTVLVMLDAWLDAALSPAWLQSRPVIATYVSVFFVVAGDLRWWLLFERYTSPWDARAPLSRRAWLRTLGWSLAVPVASSFQQASAPPAFRGGRWQLLAYDVMFLALVLVWRFRLLPGKLDALDAPVARWLELIATFEIVMYALWALSDVIILRGVEGGHGLRLLPTFMFYAAFVPFVMLTAPREVRAGTVSTAA